MATYKIRGNSHCVLFPYKTESGETKKQWETYTTELEALTRQTYIGYLQKTRDVDGLQKAINEYRESRLLSKLEREATMEASLEKPTHSTKKNLHRTYRDFALKWLPFQARKKRFSPKTYDSYLSNMENHIFPFLGDRVMSTITSSDIDNFVDYLSKKPCKGCRSYNKKPKDIPHLASGTVKRVFNVFNSGLETAKRWEYINDIPRSSAPAEKTKKRKAWEYQQVSATLDAIEDRILHLAVHLAFVCSLRAGETAGIDIKTIDFRDRSFWITQEVLRASDESLKELPQNEVIRVFPKEVNTAKSSLILKAPKTEGSFRKQYLTTPLLQEISERLRDIEDDKAFFGKEYMDYGLLICKPDGRPYDPNSFVKPFKQCQTDMGIADCDQIEFQGLRKSGQMHKVRLTQNNYQLVAESSGQSPEVLMSNYNEAWDSEKRTLSLLVETSFYQTAATTIQTPALTDNKAKIISAILSDPALTEQLLQLLQGSAVTT